MTVRHVLVVSMALIGAGSSIAGSLETHETAQGQQLVLRSRTSSVAVHVLVRNSQGPVRGLTAADFQLKDSGVLQEIAALTTGPMPLDVTVVIDQLAQSEFASRNRHPQVEEIERALTADDRIRVISVGTDIHEVQSLDRPGRAATAQPESRDDNAAVYDGVASALLRASTPGRQHVVLVLTEAYDWYSFTSPEVLGDIAKRSGAQMHVLAAEGRTVKTRTLGRSPAAWAADDGLATLVDLAKATGGNLMRTNLMTRSISRAVSRIFDDVRAGYVLYYTPAGAGTAGWHPLSVVVTRPGNFEVRARPGYEN